MSARSAGVLVAAGVVVGCSLLYAERKPKAAPPDAAVEPEVTDLLQREVTSPLDRRTSLQPLLKRLPDNVAARWQSGFTKTEKSWRSFDAPLDSECAALLDEYQNRRSEAPQTVRGQLALAYWCSTHDLKDEERAHRTAALVLANPAEQAPILKSLGYQQAGGEWRSPREVKDWRRSAQAAETSLRLWGPRVEQIVRQFRGNSRERGTARAALLEIRDPGAIPALEVYLGPHDPAMLADKLATMPAYEASLSLARFAVFANSADTRESAIRVLCGRRKEDFVPDLIQLLSTPISTRFAVGANSKGWLCESVLTRETSNRLQVWRSSKAYLPIVPTITIFDDQSTALVGVGDLDSIQPLWANNSSDLVRGPLPGAVINDVSRSISDHAYLSSRNASMQNRSIGELNGRITAVLSAVSGGEKYTVASEWWAWWAAESGQQPAGTKIVDEFTDIEVIRPVILQFTHTSCFHAGTPVWTESGLRAVEEIRIGDRVLAQDLETGALEYKPVLQTTVGAPRRMVRVTARGESVTSTSDHRFWVSGEAWTKARDLTAKHLLHTARGTIRVESVTEADVDRTYNLVVADFHSYFVGKQAILVQDLPLPRSTNCVVPGLRPEW